MRARPKLLLPPRHAACNPIPVSLLYPQVHAWLAAIGWGVLVPCGIVSARSFKSLGARWFHLHRIVLGMGFTLGTVALGLGFAAAGGWSASSSSEQAMGRGVVLCCVLRIWGGCWHASA